MMELGSSKQWSRSQNRAPWHNDAAGSSMRAAYNWDQEMIVVEEHLKRCGWCCFCRCRGVVEPVDCCVRESGPGVGFHESEIMHS